MNDDIELGTRTSAPTIHRDFEIIINSRTPKLPNMSIPTVVWIKENKPFVQNFIYFANHTKNLLGLAANQVSYNDERIQDRFFV